ncbi:Hypothetical predicted protein [Olea europaea subsp. europaea]|uniref:Uncharacterized protein n=1 Tax=Olea europaea subsp. europaea TaxID=158383 RepID=A0A8S0UY18_OLEEU|nr:Hypothetical predicted protein [Olea europaea subsp. europaea]
MFVKEYEYLVETAKEQLSEDTPLEEIPVDDPNAEINVMISILAVTTQVNMEQNMQNKLKVVEQQFNSTRQPWHHYIKQLCGKVPGFIVPPFIPLSIVNNGNGKDDTIEDEENNFGEN